MWPKLHAGVGKFRILMFPNNTSAGRFAKAIAVSLPDVLCRFLSVRVLPPLDRNQQEPEPRIHETDVFPEELP